MMPGFRTRNPFKAAIAILGYAVICLFALLGLVTTFPTVTVLAVGVFIVVMFAFDAYGLRGRTPGLSGDNRTLAVVTWLGLIALIIAASIAADSWLVSPDERVARAARASQAAAARATPEPAPTAVVPAPSTATAIITPTPPPTAPSPAPSPIVTMAPASTSPPAPTPTSLATATPLAPPTPSPGTPQPVAYQVVKRNDVSLANRTRTEVRIVVPGQPSKEQKISTLAAAARGELRPNVVLITAFRTPQEERECTATVGQAELSTDGRGWNVNTGETARWGADNREIQGSVVTEADGACLLIKEERFSVPR
ncbi:MAG: hypothetical protein M3P18_17675 [Actinomycetota bacterium]|nr:hypothetical protein [Actinomycetota bacterium]